MDILCRVKRHSFASVMQYKQRHCPLVKIMKLYLFTCSISRTAMRVTVNLECMCFELQPGNIYLKQSPFSRFLVFAYV